MNDVQTESQICPEEDAAMLRVSIPMLFCQNIWAHMCTRERWRRGFSVVLAPISLGSHGQSVYLRSAIRAILAI